MDYVAYHKAETMGYALQEGPPFSVFTKRPSEHLKGHNIWLVEGLNNQYYVRQRFHVDKVLRTEGNFRFECIGDGCNIESTQSLRVYDWFSAFMDSVGNFGIGIIPLKEEFVSYFNEILANSFASGVNDDLPAPRISKMVNEVKRNERLAIGVKQTYDYQCQLCNHTITLPNGSCYAEAHHIRPLGKPHNGPDILSNIICVCPNHHVELDYFVRSLNIGSINTRRGHVIDQRFIDYHNNRVHQVEE